jgi:hypothetical protein
MKTSWFCENWQNRSGPVSSVHWKPVGYNSKFQILIFNEKTKNQENQMINWKNRLVYRFSFKFWILNKKLTKIRSINQKDRWINWKTRSVFGFSPNFENWILYWKLFGVSVVFGKTGEEWFSPPYRWVNPWL